MRVRQQRSHSQRRGVTLVEMLVAVTLLVLMMTVIVTIFSSATNAVSGLQAFHQLDGDLRQLDTTIRRDLSGVTARLTPPLDPNENRGYLEIGENSFADLQAEDTDDYIRFTAKAPEGQPFTGRIWLGAASGSPNQPVMITSQHAEIIYFLRNGNLYRRVLLIVPEKQSAVNTAWANAGGVAGDPPPLFYPAILGGAAVRWQGVNDISARPAASGAAASGLTFFPIVLNSLSDLTNRENRAFNPRFANDYTDITGAAGPDGIPDDNNRDGSGVGNPVGDSIPDYYPTLYPGMPTSLLNDPPAPNTLVRNAASSETLAFPFIFPGAYSRPDAESQTGSGWIHSPDPNPTPAFSSMLNRLNRINHSPLELGDSLPAPAIPNLVPGTQTWWGFPTWRETLLPRWTDPNVLIWTGNTQAYGLHPFPANANPPVAALSLPPMTIDYRASSQLYNDGLGAVVPSVAPDDSRSLWQNSWDDDLIMTGVRSFDIKVFDNAYPGYVDLGWGDDLRLQPATSPAGAPASFLSQANGAQFMDKTPAVTYWTSGSWSTINQTFAHEGRMPPVVLDHRLDAQFPNPFYPDAVPYPDYPAYTGNVGDANVAVMRLRRVWDSWSTDYSHAPATGVNPTTKLPWGPPFSPPVYPSYPAPYPVPMRGIQIQIRVADPRNERVKTLTIRQDFSDKL